MNESYEFPIFKYYGAIIRQMSNLYMYFYFDILFISKLKRF
jgi:hypothetical protein